MISLLINEQTTCVKLFLKDFIYNKYLNNKNLFKETLFKEAEDTCRSKLSINICTIKEI